MPNDETLGKPVLSANSGSKTTSAETPADRGVVADFERDWQIAGPGAASTCSHQRVHIQIDTETAIVWA